MNLKQFSVVAVAIAAATAGCGGGSSGDVDPRALALTNRPIVQEREVAARAAAEEIMVGQCMSKAGFDYPKASYAEVLDEQRREVSEPYGFATRKSVAEAVRGARASYREGQSIGQKDSYKASLTPARLAAYQQAYYGPAGPDNSAQVKLPGGETMGIVTGGCHGRALQRLYGSIAEWTRLEGTAGYLRKQIVNDTLDDAGFKAAAAKWASCATRGGISAKNPFAAAAAAKTGSQTARSKAIMVIWSCERSSKLVETGLRVERTKALKVTGEYERDILAYREKSAGAMKVAERVLAQGS